MLQNIHTHSKTRNNNAIINLIAGKDPLTDLVEGQNYSIGIHPWYSDTNFSFTEITNLAKSNSIIAIGECGLDKYRGQSVTKQLELFKWQIELAYRVQKPIIIHCVKQFDLLLKLKTEYPLNLPWIIHGFNASEEITNLCLRENFYFSLGKLLFNNAAKIQQIAYKIPLNRIFLETDDSEISIDEMYNQFSKITGHAFDKVVLQLNNNFTACFKK